MSMIPDTLHPVTPTRKKRKPPTNKAQIGATYEAVYQCLSKLNDLSLPQSMNRITQNGKIKIVLVKNNLIKEISPEQNLREEFLTYKYYSISVKGQDYIKRYESVKELLS